MFTHKSKLSRSLLAITILPLFLFAVIIVIYGTYTFSHSMYKEVETEMRSIVNCAVMLFDTAYPGDFSIPSDGSFGLYKGDSEITQAFRLLDDLKAETGVEITLFYQNCRMLTTIRSSDGERIVGTTAQNEVTEDVLLKGTAHFYTDTLIDGSTYFSYYMPLANIDGTVTGMMFAGKTGHEVHAAILAPLLPILLSGAFLLIAACICTYLYTRKLLDVLLKIRVFLAQVSTGNLNAALDPDVLMRNDELGEIGASAVHMQRSLRSLVEQDNLTGLYNRRCGEKMLRCTIEKSESSGKCFCVAIGDIDYFKKINDTYGHECGDVVLKQLSKLLHTPLTSKGYACRWGGEEFLLVFEDMQLQQACEELTLLLQRIRSLVIAYEGHSISITMTFGAAEWSGQDICQLIRQADDRLYEGKSMGRNRILS